MQKMRRYIKAFSKEDEKEKEGLENSDTAKGSLKLRNKKAGEMWEVIRHSALGLEMEKEKEEPEEDQNIKYV